MCYGIFNVRIDINACDCTRGGGEGCYLYFLPKNDNLIDKTLGWALWHLVFNVSTVVRYNVTKTVPEKQLVRTTQQQENPTLREISPLPHLL